MPVRNRTTTMESMTTNSSPFAGRPNSGPTTHSDGRNQNPLVNYELSGTIRWLDVELERIVLAVAATDGHAGPFLGQDVSVAVGDARLHGATLRELVPGTAVTVKARLPRELGGTAPDPLPALSVTASAQSG
jgi:hypothetical protein